MRRYPFLLVFSFTALLAACGGDTSSTSTSSSGGSANNAPATTLRADLSWEAPTTEADGVTPLVDLAGYKVYYRLDGQRYGSGIDVGNTTRYALNTQAVAGRYYFAVTAYDAEGNESDFSEEATKLVTQ